MTGESRTIAEDQPLVIAASALLANDSDVDGDALVLTAVSGASHGTVAYDAVSGTVTFTPAANFNGIAGFDYTVSDGTANVTGHVTITAASAPRTSRCGLGAARQ